MRPLFLLPRKQRKRIRDFKFEFKVLHSTVRLYISQTYTSEKLLNQLNDKTNAIQVVNWKIDATFSGGTQCVSGEWRVRQRNMYEEILCVNLCIVFSAHFILSTWKRWQRSNGRKKDEQKKKTRKFLLLCAQQQQSLWKCTLFTWWIYLHRFNAEEVTISVKTTTISSHEKLSLCCFTGGGNKIFMLMCFVQSHPWSQEYNNACHRNLSICVYVYMNREELHTHTHNKPNEKKYSRTQIYGNAKFNNVFILRIHWHSSFLTAIQS